jgi:hypothetical protein
MEFLELHVCLERKHRVSAMILKQEHPRKTALGLRSLKNWFLLVISVTFALGLAEIALRILRRGDPIHPPAYVGQYVNRPSKNFDSDLDTGWRMRPNHEFNWSIDGHMNTYRSNRQGFRSERNFLDSPGMLIAVTGDSFTWGTGVDYGETFGALIEKNLDRVVVDNFAMPGFGVDQMWMSVRHQILPLHPSLVVVAFIDEDFSRSLMAYREVEGFNKPRFILSSGTLCRHRPMVRVV